MNAIVYIVYWLSLLFFLVHEKSPFHEWAENHPWISIPLFFVLGGIGASVIL